MLITMVFEGNRESDDMAFIETDGAVQFMIQRMNDMMCYSWEQEWNTRVDSDNKSRAIPEETWKADSQKWSLHILLCSII